MKRIKVIVEKHEDGYLVYPLGLKGIVVGEGDTCDEALADVKSAIRFHIDTFGKEVLEDDCQILEVLSPRREFEADAEIPRRCSQTEGHQIL